MIRSILFALLLLILTGSTNTAARRFLQIDCLLLDFSGKLYKKKPGGLCLFQKDGTTIYASYRANLLVKEFANGTREWAAPIPVHHEMSLTHDGNILLLSESIRRFRGDNNARFDVFKILNQEGEELASWDTFDHFDEILQILKEAGKDFPLKLDVKSNPFGEFVEYTHANSFKEVPPNSLYPAIPYLKPGNYILGMNCLGLFLFLDRDLKKIVGVVHYQSFLSCNTHDAQVLTNGHILHLLNYEALPSNGMTLVEIDPLSGERVWEYKNKLSDSLNSNYQGSVQLLANGNMLYIDNGQIDNKTPVEISREGLLVNALDRSTVVEMIGFKPYRARSSDDLKSHMDNSW